nr:uncharacterized protein LOC105884542 [Microcebus murinus]
MSDASSWGQRAGRRVRVSWPQGLGEKGAEEGRWDAGASARAVALPAAAGFGSSLFPTPPGHKVYSEAAAPRRGSSAQVCPRSRASAGLLSRPPRASTSLARRPGAPALPPARRPQLPPCQAGTQPEGLRTELGCGTEPPPSASVGSRPEPEWRSARAALASGARRRDSLAPRPQPGTSSLPTHPALDPQPQTSLTFLENSEPLPGKRAVKTLSESHAGRPMLLGTELDQKCFDWLVMTRQSVMLG